MGVRHRGGGRALVPGARADISIRAERQERVVQFSIRDTGAGIDPGQLPHVFDRFWQAKESARAGTGLGLAICKGIVEDHGGRIWGERILGEGAAFYFTLLAAT